MSGEQNDAVPGNEPAVEIEEDGNDADFESGFSGEAVSATETPAQTPDPAKTDSASAAPAPAPAPAEPVKPAPTSEDALTALRQQVEQGLQVNAQLRGQLDKVFGKMGALEQVISKLQTETPAGEVVSASEEDFAELKAEYPELAKLTLAGLNRAIGKVKGTGAADPKAIDERIGESLKTYQQTAQKDTTELMLNAVLPGWRKEVNTPEYQAWIATQPADVQKLADSNDAVDAATLLRKFDRHLTLKSMAPASTPAPAPAQGKGNDRQRRLAAAVPVRGDGLSQPSTTPEEDPFEVGFRTGNS